MIKIKENNFSNNLFKMFYLNDFLLRTKFVFKYKKQIGNYLEM